MLFSKNFKMAIGVSVILLRNDNGCSLTTNFPLLLTFELLLCPEPLLWGNLLGEMNRVDCWGSPRLYFREDYIALVFLVLYFSEMKTMCSWSRESIVESQQHALCICFCSLIICYNCIQDHWTFIFLSIFLIHFYLVTRFYL